MRASSFLIREYLYKITSFFPLAPLITLGSRAHTYPRSVQKTVQKARQGKAPNRTEQYCTHSQCIHTEAARKGKAQVLQAARFFALLILPRRNSSLPLLTSHRIAHAFSINLALAKLILLAFCVLGETRRRCASRRCVGGPASSHTLFAPLRRAISSHPPQRELFTQMHIRDAQSLGCAH